MAAVDPLHKLPPPCSSRETDSTAFLSVLDRKKHALIERQPKSGIKGHVGRP